MMKYVRIPFELVILGLLVTGCAHHENSELPTKDDNNFNSALWMQSSAEFEANSLQIYNIAMGNLEALVKNDGKSAVIEQKAPYKSLPPAVIMDIDETVLNNSSYDAQLILGGDTYSSTTWNHWVSLAQATALPGAVDFINHAKQNGVEVIFITNRKCKEKASGTEKCPQKPETIDNLEKVGISRVHPSTVLLRMEQEGWSSEKASRRELVAEKYRVVMLFGDDLGDFLPNVKKDITPAERARLVAENKEKWGRVWYVLPNPKYGSWLRVLKDPKTQYLEGY